MSIDISTASETQLPFDHIPLIDIQALYGNDPIARQQVADQLGHAAHHVGFFYISGHQLSKAVQEALLTQTKAFFDLSFEAKMQYYAGKFGIKHRGYVPEGEEVIDPTRKPDRKEAFDLSWDLPEDDPDVLAGKPMHGSNVWADLPDFKKDIGAYYAEVIALGRVLLRGFELALGLEVDTLNRLVTKPTSQLRLLHYPYDETVVDVQGIGAHTDMELFTILLPTAPGLEVMNSAGQWIDAPPIEGAFVVNIGDMTEALSGGRFVATSHRVRKVAEERYSFPLFFACDYDVQIEPLPQFRTPETVAKYPLLIAGEHLFSVSSDGFAYMKKMKEAGTLTFHSSTQKFGQHRQTM